MHTYTHNRILLSQKKKEILPIATTLMDLGVLCLVKCQKKANTLYY